MGTPIRDPRVWGVGLHYEATPDSMPIVELAVQAEQMGFDSLFLPEHTHIPTSRRTPFPEGGEIPNSLLRLWDPFTALSFVAARTGLVVGTCVALPGEHDPIALAKATATLDVMSSGRFVMGVGFGWNVEEFEDHGFEASVRQAVAIEKIALMKNIWTEDVASYEGTHVRLSPSWSWPKPLQQPHPPVLLGGRPVPLTFKRIASWADGWIPLSTSYLPTLREDLARLQEEWERAGRTSSPHVMVMQAAGELSRLEDRVAEYRELGVDRVLINVPAVSTTELMPLLESIVAALG